MKVSYGIFIVVILCFHVVYCQSMTAITSITNNLVHNLGSNVSITCTVVSPIKVNISWVKINRANPINSVVLSSGDKIIVNDSRFSLIQDVAFKKHFQSNCYTLQILHFHKTDAGIYRCLVSENTNNTISADTEIEMSVPSTITSAPIHLINIKQGEPLTLECFARGVPMPVVEWRREGGTNSITGISIHRTNVLKFKAVKKEDRGLYRCVAINGIGNNAVYETNIVVEFPPIVTSTKRFQTPVLNNFIDLHCHIEAYPTPSIVWLHNENELINNRNIKINSLVSSREVTDSVLHIYEVKKYNYGNYTCKASNVLGTTNVTITLLES